MRSLTATPVMEEISPFSGQGRRAFLYLKSVRLFNGQQKIPGDLSPGIWRSRRNSFSRSLFGRLLRFGKGAAPCDGPPAFCRKFSR